MKNEIRKRVARILMEEFFSESIGDLQREKLKTVLNSLEFKDDIIKAGGEIYAVGGIVRDAIMGTPSDDLDIVVRGVPYDKLFRILSRYGTAKDTSHVDESGKKDFGSTKFVSKNKNFNDYLSNNGMVRDIDVMLPRKDAKDPGVKGHKGIKSDVNPMYTIFDDLDRRDITINAIAMDLDGKIISNGTGLEDIKNGIIRAVSEESFIEDPVRMMRAVRFAAKYNYKWDPATINLIKNNVHLLSDKQELPKERFLMEFKKMIGKADLVRAVKMLVDFGMYKAIFGIESKLVDYSKFSKAKNVGEFAYMMFENEPMNTIVSLIRDNITNDSYNLSFADALVKYRSLPDSRVQPELDRINQLASLYRLSPDAMTESSYIDDGDKKITLKFKSGELPKNDNDLAFKGDEFKQFIIDKVTENFGGFDPKRDGVKMGRAKLVALQGIYAGMIRNNANEIKELLEKRKEEWL
jgi:tRNA nucleotidyltransferase/poly(A) polymerase